MKKLLLVSLVLFISANVLAFGGGGSGRVASHYKSGVDSFGIHYGGDGDVEIDIRDCDDEGETWTGDQCCPNSFVYIKNGYQKCCNDDGYKLQGGECIKTCPMGFVLLGEDCVDLCENWDRDGAPTCARECDWRTGLGIPESEDTICGNHMHCSGVDNLCVCDETFVLKDEYSCGCPDQYVIESGKCVSLCANYEATICKPSCDWTTGEGIPATDKPSCGTNKVCDTNGECVWASCSDSNKERNDETNGECLCKNRNSHGCDADTQVFNTETCACEWSICDDSNKERNGLGVCVCKTINDK